jgi:uncharacterized Zn-finger protein
MSCHSPRRMLPHSPARRMLSDVSPLMSGGGALGHPIEYISLNNVLDPIGVCKYCGLRYKAKHH